MTITCTLYTNGQWHDAEGHATFTRHNPLTQENASVASVSAMARYDTRRTATPPAGRCRRDAAP